MAISSQQGTTKHYDVLVIGSGLAGLYFCNHLMHRAPNTRIALISKATLEEGSSLYAQGGIAASQHEDISTHIHDTLKASDGLADPSMVETIINQSQQVIDTLTQSNVPFTKDASGQYLLAREGGHSQRRIYFSGDETGKAIVHQLLNNILSHPLIDCYPNHCAINLVTNNQHSKRHTQQEVTGAYILNEDNKIIDLFLANATILATGGAGKVFRYTTNPEVATGDGIAMAYRAGARVGNMEFYQFHPTLLYHPTINNFLISEALRGEGAKLKNADTLKPFMQHYAPEEQDLATRDIVARAIFSEIEHSDSDHVYLDISHKSKDYLKERFPKIYTTLLSIGIDISQDMIPVVPAAHYLCGGIVTDQWGQTDLQRLFAIGETAFTGFHGANRLASNSLLEACVMANQVIDACTTWLDKPIPTSCLPPLWQSGNKINRRRASQINAHWRGLRGEMTSYAGIVRTEAGLHDCLTLIRIRKKIIEDYYWQHQITKDFIELRNITLVAELIVKSALLRTESRGGHFREDHPKKYPHSVDTILATECAHQTVVEE